jgi:hypothetical protein
VVRLDSFPVKSTALWMMLRLVRDEDDEKDFMRLLLFSPPVVLPLSPFDEFDLPPLPVEPPDPFAPFKIMAMMF